MYLPYKSKLTGIFAKISRFVLQMSSKMTLAMTGAIHRRERSCLSKFSIQLLVTALADAILMTSQFD